MRGTLTKLVRVLLIGASPYKIKPRDAPCV